MPTPLHLDSLPANPGIYMFKNTEDQILYVGKALNLRSRVRSYFRSKANLEPAKQQMIPEISAVTTIVVDSENEALILEANLIRKHRPPYNVVLRDDKYYLFIKITNEEFPRVLPVRHITKDGARYFGPYSSARSVRQTLKLLRRIFPHASDKSPAQAVRAREKIFPHPLFSTDLKNNWTQNKQQKSAGGKSGWVVSRKHYQNNIRRIIQFLKGERREVIDKLKSGMKNASRNKKFEQAAIFRDQLQALERLEGSQKVYLASQESFDVVSIVSDLGRSAANVFAIRGGKLLNKNTFLLKSRGPVRNADILRQFILQYYGDAQDIPKLIIIPESLSDQTTLAAYISKVSPPKLIVPRRGKKKHLIIMGELNAKQFLVEENLLWQQDRRFNDAAKELAAALGLGRRVLSRIETYDISNIQGTLATGAMIVFTNGILDKSQYRKFRLKLNGSPNDFAMLQEVVRRRFAARNSTWPKPDLLLIDGGKGQLSSVKKVLTDLNMPVPVAALAKREEEIFIYSKNANRGAGSARFTSIRLPYDSDALYLVQRMRDEAHRFTLSYHQLLRSKKYVRSLLDEIPGIGPKTKKKLISHFGSLNKIKMASDDELKSVIGSKVKLLRDYL